MEPNAAPTSRSQAPYGRACSNCARAKARCISGNSVGAKCERCFRLNKDCQPIQTIRKRKAVNKPSTSKTERLEEKLDGLFKLLQSSTTPTSIDGQDAVSSTPTLTEPSPDSSQPHDASPEHGEDVGSHSIRRMDCYRPSIDGLRLSPPTASPDDAHGMPGTRSTIRSSPGSAFISGLGPSYDEAEECLNNFRPHMAIYFPFIIVPQSMSAYELHRDRPFLWLCIMSIASKSTVQQKALGKEIRTMMGREILVEGKNNIDLLLGILVFVAWGNYHIHDKPIIVQSNQLAMALVGNLGLNKPPLKEPAHVMLNLDARGCPIRPFSSSARTMEERRAVLGCFLLSSVLSSYFQRFDTLRWTPYLDECIAVLTENKEYPSDTLLIHLVKLQLIVENVRQNPWDEEHNGFTVTTRAPPTFYLRALQLQLQDFKLKIPAELQRNDVLLLHLYSTELRAHEFALSKIPAVINSPGFQRLDSLYACLHAIKSWFDLFLSLSPASYVGFPMQVFVQMASCVIALFRLTTFDDLSWDRRLVKDTANLSHILERLIEISRQVKEAADLDHGISDEIDIFNVNARTLRSIKTWWDAKLAAELTDNIILDDTLGEINVDCFDDVWLRDILGQGDGQFELNVQ